MLLRYDKVDKHTVKKGKQVREIKIDDALRNLADSMVKDGQLQPIGLLEDKTLIWGFRRHAAALLTPEITHLWAAIFSQEVSEQQFLVMRATENFQRLELSAYERWQTVEELARINPSWTNAELGVFLHVHAASITHLRSPGKCVPAIQEALKAGRITIADCYPLSRASDREQHELLAAKLNGASAAEVTHRVRRARNGNKPQVRVNRINCPLPGGRSIVFSGQGITLQDAIEAAREWIKEAKEAVEKSIDAKAFQAMCQSKAKLKTEG